jgi:hypothetical protein
MRPGRSRRSTPRDLAAIVQAAILERFDRALYEAVLVAEEELRQDVLSRLEGFGRRTDLWSTY